MRPPLISSGNVSRLMVFTPAEPASMRPPLISSGNRRKQHRQKTAGNASMRPPLISSGNPRSQRCHGQAQPRFNEAAAN